MNKNSTTPTKPIITTTTTNSTTTTTTKKSLSNEEAQQQFKNELKKAVEGVKLIKKCIYAAQNGQLNNQMALETVKTIVQLHQNLTQRATQYSALETTHSKRMLSFVNNTMKQTVLQLGNGLKMLIKSNDTALLEKYTPEFITHIKHLLTLLRDDSSVEELNNPSSSSTIAPVPNQKQSLSSLPPPPRLSKRASRSTVPSSSSSLTVPSSSVRVSSSSRTKVRSSRMATSPAEIQEKELEHIKKTLVDPKPDQRVAPLPTATTTTTTGSNKPITPTIITVSLPQQIDEEEEQEENQTVIPSETSMSSFIGCYSDPGDRYGDTNQDSFMCCKSGQGYILCIFDGHGANGEIASEVASKSFKDYFSCFDFFSLDKKKQHSSIREAFMIAHKNIIQQYQNEKLKKIHWNGVNFELKEEDGLLVYYNRKYGMILQDFGTTAVFAAVKAVGGRATHLTIANAGDSIAVIGRTVDGEFEARDNLCCIHNGRSPTEMERIAKYGCALVEEEENYIAAPEESGFHWAQLAVTRSLGHKYFFDYGVIPEPYISNYNLHQDDKYLILTSDGVTDVLSAEEIIEVVGWHDHYSEGNMQVVAKELVRYSLRNWDEEADNTTAIVVKLQ